MVLYLLLLYSMLTETLQGGVAASLGSGETEGKGLAQAHTTKAENHNVHRAC